MMSRAYQIFFIVALVLIFSACEKTRNVQWMFYAETQCADKWKYHSTNEKLKENVEEYLKSRDIKVFETEILNYGTPEACSACTCKTGRTIKCKVRSRDVDRIKAEGFSESL